MPISTEDHTAITRLMYEYARCADVKDYPGFDQVFCEDAVFDYHGDQVQPRSAIAQMMRNLEQFSVTQHLVANVLYEVKGDSAHGETYCVAVHILPQGDTSEKIDMGIKYVDELRRTAQGWRILRRVFTVLWTQTSVLEASGA